MQRAELQLVVCQAGCFGPVSAHHIAKSWKNDSSDLPGTWIRVKGGWKLSVVTFFFTLKIKNKFILTGN